MSATRNADTQSHLALVPSAPASSTHLAPSPAPRAPLPPSIWRQRHAAPPSLRTAIREAWRQRERVVAIFDDGDVPAFVDGEIRALDGPEVAAALPLVDHVHAREGVIPVLVPTAPGTFAIVRVPTSTAPRRATPAPPTPPAPPAVVRISSGAKLPPSLRRARREAKPWHQRAIEVAWRNRGEVFAIVDAGNVPEVRGGEVETHAADEMLAETIAELARRSGTAIVVACGPDGRRELVRIPRPGASSASKPTAPRRPTDGGFLSGVRAGREEACDELLDRTAAIEAKRPRLAAELRSIAVAIRSRGAS